MHAKRKHNSAGYIDTMKNIIRPSVKCKQDVLPTRSIAMVMHWILCMFYSGAAFYRNLDYESDLEVDE